MLGLEAVGGVAHCEVWTKVSLLKPSEPGSPGSAPARHSESRPLPRPCGGAFSSLNFAPMPYLPADKRTFSLIPATDYKANDDTNPWLIRPLLRIGSSMMLYGRQGTGKSRLAWQLAYAFASGTSWVGFPVERAGPVIFLEVDMPEWDLQFMIDNAAGLGINHPDIHVINPRTPLNDYFTDFDILRRADRLSLESAIHDIKPVLLVVDAVNDIFRSKGKDVNDEARHALRTVRAMMQGYGAFVYLHHERKASQMHSKSSEDAPGARKDSWLGATAFDGIATSSIQIKDAGIGGQSGHKVLLFQKERLGPVGVGQLSIEMTKPYGFFETKLSVAQALILWKGDDLGSPHSLKEVFAEIAQKVGASEDAVKKAFQRQRENGVEHAWLSHLGGDTL